jgi:hypothetical protein
MSLYRASVPQLRTMLGSIETWLDKAAAHAQAKGYDVEGLLSSRLAPDQYPLLRQIQAACDAAKFAAARLTGREAPKHPDTEANLAEIRARVKSVLTYLGDFSEKDFEGASERVVELSFMPGKGILAGDYLNQMALPNFYFHLTHAYAILRHNGVELGKRDFISTLTLRDL